MSTVTVNVDDRLVRLVRSRLFGVVAALQGVSITFAPAFLYWSGQRKFLGSEWLVVPVVLCNDFPNSSGLFPVGKRNRCRTQENVSFV